MVALLVLALRRAPRDRWVKYAGNWSPTTRDSATYQLQRTWLKRGWARAEVTVNGHWPDQPSWVRAFDNPTLTAEEVAAGRTSADAKPPGPPYRVVFAGRLERPKGAHLAVEAVRELRERGVDIELDLVGDGPLRSWVEEQAVAAGSAIRLHGWVRRDQLEEYLTQGHVFLLPTSASEGFPKVIAEAMAFGCVPVTSSVSSIGQVLAETGGSVVVPEGASWANAVEDVVLHSRQALMSAGLDQVSRFTYATYLHRVRTFAHEAWGRDL
jgi:glycosyltransferase involved in cell wall biosynthesis